MGAGGCSRRRRGSRCSKGGQGCKRAGWGIFWGDGDPCNERVAIPRRPPGDDRQLCQSPRRGSSGDYGQGEPGQRTRTPPAARDAPPKSAALAPRACPVFCAAARSISGRRLAEPRSTATRLRIGLFLPMSSPARPQNGPRSTPERPGHHPIGPTSTRHRPQIHRCSSAGRMLRAGIPMWGS